MHHLEFTTDALLVSNFYNILYLSGFKGLTSEEREAWMLVTKNNIYFFTDGRYEGQVPSIKNQVPSLETRIISHEKKLIDYLKEIVEKENIKTIGFESEDLKVDEFERFKAKLTSKLVSTPGVIMKLRAIKSPEEITKIEEACKLSDLCLSEIVKTIEVGQTEAEIAFKMEMWILKKGLDMAFYPIVAIDANSAEAHYDTRNHGKEKIKKGSVILIDFGITYKNYRSDMTRMVFMGNPSTDVINTYDGLLKSQEGGIQALSKTKNASEIDATCRKILKSLKLPNYSHSTGHGVGLEIHENPRLSILSKDVLQKGHMVTVEPGVYFSGKWGMRIEDTVALTANLKPTILTRFPKKMVII